MNVTFSGTCCLTGMTIGEVMANADAWRVAAAARGGGGGGESRRHPARSRRADRAHPQARCRIGNARPSMLLDHLARRRSEIDVINARSARGRQFGVPTPVNDTVVALVKAREAGFSA